ncbi:unnamed protein product (macronuclear) [Paramecium tetraurelia]|uniref:Uncharacterized protein n=1 Tax=Paramecium tetraurelia TaxID=5888 RepID=A0C0N3_PARTE|nr:uncharacterized protein GSPATT00006203001 [Paramecium tetraurelia]CAK64350.1 unnamed protein product [Paramecium tetraurelia]|eukprot:XP_001431748.1 hypothetical protein (macronuclear) [Paramecium tetraurelia strain d4-2]
MDKVLKNIQYTLGIQFYQVEITQYEQKELQQMFCVIKDKMHCLESQNYTIEKEVRALKSENDELQYFIQEKKQILNQLRSLIEILEVSQEDQQLDGDSLIKIYHILQTYTPRKQQVGIDILLNIQTEEQQILQLKKLLQSIENQTIALDMNDLFWSCIRCSKILQEGQNEQTCIYHSGKLKYYSCRSCGADEYFTCCHQCRDCNSGCKIGLHKP